MRSFLRKIQRPAGLMALAAVVSVVAGAQVAEACAQEVNYSNYSTKTHFVCTLVRQDLLTNQCIYNCKQTQLRDMVGG